MFEKVLPLFSFSGKLRKHEKVPAIMNLCFDISFLHKLSLRVFVCQLPTFFINTYLAGFGHCQVSWASLSMRHLGK